MRSSLMFITPATSYQTLEVRTPAIAYAYAGAKANELAIAFTFAVKFALNISGKFYGLS